MDGRETNVAYSDFTLADLKQRFDITVEESRDLFADVAEVDLPPGLADRLVLYHPLAMDLNTEKARSELLIAPLLIDFKFLHRDRISLFSGLEFNVDEEAGLKGKCDFILARSPQQLFLTAPVCVVVEAKNENIMAGIPQCLAEMMAAQKFNAQRKSPQKVIYGTVATGSLWRFLQLEERKATVEAMEYPIHSARKIFGILTKIALEDDLT